MDDRLQRSIEEPIRQGLDWDELWLGPDRGLIRCWERGRQKRLEDPDLAARAERGELVMLAWKGGVTYKLKCRLAKGTLHYLATWQGLRGQNLDISLCGKQTVVCSRTGQAVSFAGGIGAAK